MSERRIVTCDKCKEEIAKNAMYIAGSVYGVDFHTTCFEKMSAAEYVNLAGIDDIYYHQNNSNSEYNKLIHQDWFRALLIKLTQC